MRRFARGYGIAGCALGVLFFMVPHAALAADTTPPTVTLTGPIDGQEVLKNDLLGLTADASDDTGVDTVQFWANGEFLFPDDTAPYEYSWNTNATSSGEKTIVAVARDAAGNVATSAPVTINLINFEGSGTQDDPYELEECFQFPTINDFLDASYVLEGDLDCTGYGNNVMIGADTTPFTGDFDGGGHAVTLDIDDESSEYMGLFRAAEGATIENIGILGQVQGGNMTGSLVGMASSSAITNASSSAIVVGLGEPSSPPLVGSGGLVGSLVGGSILGSRFDGAILGTIAVGGIAGGRQ